ncbi:MAG: hypothetical protein AAGK33_04625 [Pseudomonadota bacterium]
MTNTDVIWIAALVALVHVVPVALAYAQKGNKRFTARDKRTVWQRFLWAFFGIDGTKETVFETPGLAEKKPAKRKKAPLVSSTSRRLRKLKVSALRSRRTGFFEPPVARAGKR